MKKYEAPSIEFYVFEMPESIMDSGCTMYQCSDSIPCIVDGQCIMDGASCITDGICITDGTCAADVSGV